ncbi:arsenate reductase (glutaredoxin) [Flavobacterium sp.]|uniref:arsenate reductase (glutaredoxin) n=1 Tax=Flavobacterium sp. TaxID=239 RepID=UPI002FDA667E
MIEILHNPRCGKSREGKAILDELGKEYEIVNYLKEPISESKLEEILKKLKCSAQAIIRTKEPLWITQYKDKNLSEKQLIQILLENPILIERPIVITDSKAIVGRPPVLIKTLF